MIAFAALPLDRPMLRVANALSRPVSAEGEAGPSGSGVGSGGGVGTRRLTDVHVGVPPSKVVGGTSAPRGRQLRVLTITSRYAVTVFTGVLIRTKFRFTLLDRLLSLSLRPDLAVSSC